MDMVGDPVTAAGLTTRDVRTSTRDGRPTRVVVARRTYGTDRDDLWDALTNPERLPRWFLPVSGDLEVGGRYSLEGNASGTIQDCDRPRSLATTWEMGDMVSWLTVTLHPADTDDATTLELLHEAPVDPDMWTQFGPGAVGIGWDLALLGLGLHVDTDAAVDPAAGMAFPSTPEGTQFVRAAATDWAAAAIADGDDPDAAGAAAEQSVGFYTTMPDAGS